MNVDRAHVGRKIWSKLTLWYL